MNLRPYENADCQAMARLFYDTVHTVNAADYTPAQLDAWATGQVDIMAWDASFLAHHTLVAVENNEIIGFADMDDTGYLDRLYVHYAHQREGVATALCDALEEASSAEKFSTHASITARPFFEKRGYRVVKEQQVERFGVWMTNFCMKRPENNIRVFRIVEVIQCRAVFFRFSLLYTGNCRFVIPKEWLLSSELYQHFHQCFLLRSI